MSAQNSSGKTSWTGQAKAAEPLLLFGKVFQSVLLHAEQNSREI
jgi:hypothetical protein